MHDCAVRSFALRDDPQRLVRQGPLQLERLGRVRLKPKLDLFRRRQDDRHGLRVDRRDDRVGLCRQEAEQLVLAVNGRALRPAHAMPGRPEAGEGEERPILIQREPDRRLARLGVGIFAKRCRRDDAAAPLAEPSPPVRAFHVADVRYRRAAELRRPGHSPARHDELALAVGANANDRGQLVGKDRRQRRQVAGAIVFDGEEIADRRLALGDAVEVAHGPDYAAARAGTKGRRSNRGAPAGLDNLRPASRLQDGEALTIANSALASCAQSSWLNAVIRRRFARPSPQCPA